jgi:hypothetical protein
MIFQKANCNGFAAAILVVFAALLVVATLPVGAYAQQIDGENERGMVIDDMWYPFADNVAFYANPEKTILANRGDFSIGTNIGYELDEDGKISAVWLR